MEEQLVTCPHCGAHTQRSMIRTICEHCAGSLESAAPVFGPDEPPPGEFRIDPLPPPDPLPAIEPPHEAPLAAPEADLPLLAPAPRAVPLALRVQLLFGGTLGLVGWIFATMGSIFLIPFVPAADLVSPAMRVLPTERTTAVVTSCRETSFSEGDDDRSGRVYAFGFEYRTGTGQALQATSYRTGDPLPGGTIVRVRYLASRPGVARIEDMRARPFAAWVLFVLVFPLIGSGIATPVYLQGRKAIALLRDGLPARGTFARMDGTNVEVNDMPLMRLTFSFATPDGETHQVKASTVEPGRLRDQQRELVLYNPQRPEVAVLLDGLPTRVTLTDAGEWQPACGRGTVWLVLMPLGTFVCVLVTVWLLVR